MGWRPRILGIGYPQSGENKPRAHAKFISPEIAWRGNALNPRSCALAARVSGLPAVARFVRALQAEPSTPPTGRAQVQLRSFQNTRASVCRYIAASLSLGGNAGISGQFHRARGLSPANQTRFIVAATRNAPGLLEMPSPPMRRGRRAERRGSLWSRVPLPEHASASRRAACARTVSYTHLTLPTILRV